MTTHDINEKAQKDKHNYFENATIVIFNFLNYQSYILVWFLFNHYFLFNTVILSHFL
jgi:hypothetical protein